MFIRVKYGDDETILCNPSCAVINLLTSIKTRTGHAQQSFTIDLTDVTGLVQELDAHRHDCASKFLSAPGTYILVKKQLATPPDEAAPLDDSSQYEYVPLLNNWRELFPGYRLQRVSTAGGGGGRDEARQRLVGRTRDARTKADSPAGIKATARTGRQLSKDRTPSRRR